MCLEDRVLRQEAAMDIVALFYDLDILRNTPSDRPCPLQNAASGADAIAIIADPIEKEPCTSAKS